MPDRPDTADAAGGHASLLPADGRHPYYVVAPAYQRNSVGVRCLHLLVHWLNRIGQSAWLLTSSGGPGLRVNPEWVTPELTPAVYKYHQTSGRAPIVVYPETVRGNPLRASLPVRYILNFPGLLGGAISFPPDDLVFAYSQVLADTVGASGNVLHMPVLDTNLFSPQPVVERQGTCHYFGKYRLVHGGDAFGLPPGSVEIPRDAKVMDQATIAAIFRRSRLFYTYENTGLITEACLCGCPVVMMPNPWLTVGIADQELGRDGIAWGDSPEQVAHACATVGLVRARYQQTIQAFFPQLDRFVELTQAHARKRPAPALIYLEGVGSMSTAAQLPIPSFTRILRGLAFRAQMFGRSLRIRSG